MLVFMIWILQNGCLPFLSFSVQMILWVCYTWELPFAVSLLFARDELYSEGKYVTARFLWTLTRVLIFWHHRMLSFMSIQSLLVSLFIDLSCDHLYTVLLFIYDLKSTYPFHFLCIMTCFSSNHRLPLVGVYPILYIVFVAVRVTLDSLPLSWFQAIYPSGGSPTLVQTQACGPLNRHIDIWLSDCIHSRA